MRRALQRIAALTAAATAFATVSFGYYHYLHYTTASSPYAAVPERFDLAALPNNTLSFFVSRNQADAQLASGDTFSGVLSQIRAAAKVWNDVDTSRLRLAYGGLNDGDAGNNSPSIEVMLGEVPPGLVATTARTVTADANESFVPVGKAVIVIRQDLRDKPSYGEAFFGTVVHEFGHALGLQHTLTGSVMSTGITRATSRSRPLTADDVAGVSLLYPANGFSARTGSISGRVTSGGNGVHLASVVALAIDGPALSTLTNPDGTYRIDGLPPREYLVYVAPLPPAQQGQGETTPANLTFPWAADGSVTKPSGSFETVFHPAKRTPDGATKLAIVAGRTNEDIDFSVAARTAPAIHSVSTFSYPGSFSVKPAYLNATMEYPMIVAEGTGLINASGALGGFTVSVIGGGPLPYRAFPGYPKWAVIDIDASTLKAMADGPKHLLFTAPNDIYILPAGFWKAQDAPPFLTLVSSVGDSSNTVAITGSNLRDDSRILFDGMPATQREFQDGRMLVSPPHAPRSYRANVVAVNTDGQSSAFVQSPALTFAFDSLPNLSAASPVTTVTPGRLTVGSIARIEVSSPGANFVPGQAALGFGTSDVTVQRLWVVDGSTLQANVTVAPGASPGLIQPVVVSGLQTVSASSFEVIPPNPAVLSLVPRLVNVSSGDTYVYPGAWVEARIAGPAVNIGALGVSVSSSLTLNGVSVRIASINGNQFVFQVPFDQKPGVASLRLDSSTDQGNAVLVTIEAAPPQLLGALDASKAAIDASHALHPGDTVILRVTGLGENGAPVSADLVSVNIGPATVKPSDVKWTDTEYQVTVSIPADFSPKTAQSPVAVSINDHASNSIDLNIQ